MLNLKEIEKFYPQKLKNKRALLVEFLQHKILDIIYSSPFGKNLVFQGGTGIRILYKSNRFSEDLDFDTPKMSQKTFDELTHHITQKLQKEGYKTETRNVQKGVYRCYLKFSNILQEYHLSPHPDEKILIQLDIDEVTKKPPTTTKIINKFGILKEVITYPPHTLLSKKIHALLKRKRAKGRDIYDIVYLSSLATPNYKYLKQELDISNPQTLQHSLIRFCNTNNLKALADNVEPFLIDPSQKEIIIKFKSWIKNHF